jgi:mannose-6-phosphate isomerase-like protein (cupin superfamily)
MTPHALVAQAKDNFAVAHVGMLTDLYQFTYQFPNQSLEFEGKVFLKSVLGLSSAEISLNALKPGQSIPFYHKHQLNEEIYLFVRGQGEFQVDDIVFPVKEGTVVRVDPEGERCFRNTSDTLDLCWIVVQSRAGSYEGETIQDGYGVQKRVSWQDKTQL